MFESGLNKVTRLSILGGTIRVLALHFNALEILEVNLIAEVMMGHSYNNFRKYIDYDGLSYAFIAPHLHTLIVCKDWAVLLPYMLTNQHEMTTRFQIICSDSVRQLEIYITRSLRHARTKAASFVNLLGYIDDGTSSVPIERLRIDYRSGQDFDPRACLGDFSRADTFITFSHLRELLVLQEVLISSNYQRSMDWQMSQDVLFPPTLESLTVVCLTERILNWLEFVRVEHMDRQAIDIREVTLLCRIGHGGSPATFRTGVAIDLFNALSDIGIVAKVEEETPGAF